MMTPEKAAQYLIVAWVKDWRMRMLLDVVTERKNAPSDWDNTRRLFPWLPENPHYFITNSLVRTYVAAHFRALNNRLWDATDDRARLALAPQVLQVIGPDHNQAGGTLQNRRDAKEAARAKREYQAAGAVYRKSVELMRNGSGHAWNVCK